MKRSLLALGAIVLLATACSEDEDRVRPPLGERAGDVRLQVDDDPTPGGTVIVEVAADPQQKLVGGICFTVDRWVDNGWRPGHVVDSVRDSADPVVGGEWSCPAIGRRLPDSFAFTVPPNLSEGTWRIAYRWHRDGDRGGPASYVFEVRSP